MPKRAMVLITGGAGFIGSCYARTVLRDHPDWTIRILGILTYAETLANIAESDDQIEFVRGDAADPDAVEGDRTNIPSAKVLLEASSRHRVERFVHISTDDVYGDIPSTTRCSLESDPMQSGNP